MLRHIFVDLDGVLADFATAALELHGRPELFAAWPPGLWDVHTVLGITSGAFWKRLETQGAEFWASLEPFPWTFDLMTELQRIAPVTIASSPSYDPACLDGKIRWVQRHFGKKFRDFMIGPRKHLLARPDTALVDDSDRNIDAFRAHQGVGVLFPQPWNANHRQTADRVAHVLAALSPGVERESPPISGLEWRGPE